MRRRIILTVATAVAAGALAGGTAAAEPVTYEATIDVHAEYRHAKHAVSHGPSGQATTKDATKAFSTRLRSTLPMVAFTDGRPAEERDAGQVDEWSTGTTVERVDDPWTGRTETLCASDGQPNAWGRASLLPVGAEGSALVGVRVTDLLSVTGTCSAGQTAASTLLEIDGDSDDPIGGHFDDVVEVPRAMVGQGQFALALAGGGTGEDCPGFDPAQTTECTFAWNGSISFTRADLAGDVEPIGWQPPPLPGVSPPDPGAEEARRLQEEAIERRRRSDAEKARAVREAIERYLEDERIAGDIAAAFRRDGSRARVELSCPGACSGSVTAYAASGPRSTGSGTPLARAPFRRAGARGAVAAHLRLDRADRRRLAGRRWVALRIAMRFAGSPKVQRTTLVVRARGRSRP